MIGSLAIFELLQSASIIFIFLFMVNGIAHLSAESTEAFTGEDYHLVRYEISCLFRVFRYIGRFISPLFGEV